MLFYAILWNIMRIMYRSVVLTKEEDMNITQKRSSSSYAMPKRMRFTLICGCMHQFMLNVKYEASDGEEEKEKKEKNIKVFKNFTFCVFCVGVFTFDKENIFNTCFHSRLVNSNVFLVLCVRSGSVMMLKQRQNDRKHHQAISEAHKFIYRNRYLLSDSSVPQCVSLTTSLCIEECRQLFHTIFDGRCGEYH